MHNVPGVLLETIQKLTEDRSYKVKLFASRETFEINVLEWGKASNENVIFCLHGLTRSSRDFAILASFFSKEYRVICPDLVGRGSSSWLKYKTNYHIPFYLNSLVLLINKLQLKNIDVIGTSLGGILAIFLCSNPKDYFLNFFGNTNIKKILINLRPITVKSLVPHDVGARLKFYELIKLKGGINKVPVSFHCLREVELFIREAFENSIGYQSDIEWKLLTESYVRYDCQLKCFTTHFDPGILNPFGLPSFYQEISKMGLNALPDLNLWKFYDSISIKTLLLRGMKSEILNKKHALEMNKRGPKPKLIEFKGVGHAPTLMRTDQLNAIRTFLST